MQDHLIAAAIVCLYFLIQSICLASLTILLKKYSSLQWLECVIGSIALHQIFKIFLMSLTSAIKNLGALYVPFYGFFVLILFVMAYVFLSQNKSFCWSLPKNECSNKNILFDFLVCLSLILFGGFFLLAVVRAVYFFDNQFDVENYGYSKIAFWFQNHSIFYLSGLNDMRIDSFERNGELNFLHAFLLTRDLRFIGLAGIEVWLGILLGGYFILRSLSVEIKPAIIFSVFLVSAPVVFGLSGITKGDSWAIMHLACSTGFLLSLFRKGFSNSRFFFFRAV